MYRDRDRDRVPTDFAGLAAETAAGEDGLRRIWYHNGAWLWWAKDSTFKRIRKRDLDKFLYDKVGFYREANRFERESFLFALQNETFVPGDVELPCFWEQPYVRRDDVIVAENGRFVIDDLLVGRFEPVPNSPAFLTETAFPYAIEFGSKCDRWEQFLTEVFEGDQERIDFLQEWFGYCLVPNIEHQKFLAMVGRGANGKSLVFHVLNAMIGERNTANVPVRALNGKFSHTMLAGRRLVLINELDETTLADENAIKRLVDGTPHTSERKYQDELVWVPRFKLMIACNNLPNFKDKTDGMRRRCLIVPFYRQFVGDACDLDLKSKLLAEVPGIFLWALKGLTRLRDQGRFTKSSVVEATTNEHFVAADPLAEFIRENVVACPGEALEVTDFVRNLNAELRDHGFKSEYSAASVGKALREHFRGEVDVRRERLTKKNPKGVRAYQWVGICWHYEKPAPVETVPTEIVPTVGDEYDQTFKDAGITYDEQVGDKTTQEDQS